VVEKEESCPETTTTDERDSGDLAVEEESVALYLNMIPTHTGTLISKSDHIFFLYATLFMLTNSNVNCVSVVDLIVMYQNYKLGCHGVENIFHSNTHVF
jgi:hypothetical protein